MQDLFDEHDGIEPAPPARRQPRRKPGEHLYKLVDRDTESRRWMTPERAEIENRMREYMPGVLRGKWERVP
jgi:hypothetical protein